MRVRAVGLLVLALFATAVPASAEDEYPLPPPADTTPPDLASFTLDTPGPLAPDSAVTLSYTATDDVSGVAGVDFRFTDPRSGARTVSGDAVGPATAVVSAEWPSGLHRLDTIEVTDVAGNSTTYLFDGTTWSSPPVAPALPHAFAFTTGDFAVDTGVPPAVKAPMRGIASTSGTAAPAYRPTLNTVVVGVNWSNLQPDAGGEIVADNTIDQAITATRRLNIVEPGLHQTLKLRVFAGRGAPQWAKNIGGAPVRIYDSYDGTSSTIGRFWLPEFGAAYVDLMTKLAARYDAVPEIRDVVISRCTMTYAEPLIRSISNATTRKNLRAAGYTPEADALCQTEEIDAHLVWPTTHSSLAVNPYQHLNTDGTWFIDVPYTNTLLDYCIAILQQRCTIENNSVRHPISQLGGFYEQMYAHLFTLDAPMTLQIARNDRVGSLCKSAAWAIANGAESIEIDDSHLANPDVTLDGLSAFDRALHGIEPADVTPPDAPNDLSVTPSGGGDLLVEWEPAVDDLGVACHTVSRNGVEIGAQVGSSFLDRSVAPGEHTYTVAAIDGAGLVGDVAEALAVVEPPPATTTSTTSTTTTTTTLETTTTSTPTTTTTVPSVTTQESGTGVTYGSWREVPNGRASSVYRDVVRFGFTGTGITWRAVKGPDQGKATVTIDGVNKGTIDLYASTHNSAVPITFGSLESRAHSIVVKPTGTKHASATAANVTIDAFVVGSKTTEDSAPAILWGSWLTKANNAASGGMYRTAAAKDSRAAFNFNGDSVEWITATGHYGRASVTIDGINKGTFDLYTAGAAWRVTKRFTGLGAGRHTIVVTVLGTKHASSNSAAVTVDAFVTHA